MMNPAALFSPWQAIRKDLIAMIDLFTIEEMDYRPFSSSWSVREIFLHIAETEDFWIREVVQKQPPVTSEDLTTNLPIKTLIKTRLMDSFELTQQLLEGLTVEDLEQLIQLPDGAHFRLYDILWHVIEHEIHHRGELSLVLGLLGKEGLDV